MTTIRSKVQVVCDGEGLAGEGCDATCEATLTIRELAIPRPIGPGQMMIQPFEGKHLALPEGWAAGNIPPGSAPIVLAGGQIQIDTVKESLKAIATKVQHSQPGMFCPKCAPALRRAPDGRPAIDPRRIVSGGAG